LVGLDEAAEQLAISRRSVQQLIYRGELPSVLIGRSRRIAVEDLEAYVQRLRTESDHPRLSVVTR
jgi:excisionase family DNA binding protein